MTTVFINSFILKRDIKSGGIKIWLKLFIGDENDKSEAYPRYSILFSSQIRKKLNTVLKRGK